MVSEILKMWFFKNEDICKELREVLNDLEYFENYWLFGVFENECLKCYFCEVIYVCVGFF